MAVITLTKNTFKTEVTDADKPVLIDFFATWCGPCKMVSPIVDEIAEENAQIKVCKVDVDNEPELAQLFGVTSIPTLVALKNGKMIGQAVGYRPKKDILALLNG